jgi:3-oxoacyl-[acyl-carrier protein] reductase
MDLELKDRVFLVTGGGRGLGRATAEVLVDEGARVVLSGRDGETLDTAAAELGDSARTVVADNADPDTPARLLAAAQDAWGRVDGALVSVGGPPVGPVGVTDQEWTDSFSSVFLGAVRLCREVGPQLPHGGSLALVLSTSVHSPLPNMAPSNGLRPGLAMLAKQLADELGPEGVRVNGLLPGRIATDRVAELDALTGDAEAALARMVEQIPLRRYGEPEEFGRTAAFLLSPAASFLTGVMLPVDGGMMRTF